MVTRRLFAADDAVACKCDACFSVWYKWTLEQLPEDHWSPDLAELPERIHGLRESTFATWELYVSMMDDWYRGVGELAWSG